MTKVLFVCKANICRSPLAEMYFCHQLKTRKIHTSFTVDSAGVDCPLEGSESDPMVKELCSRYEINAAAVLSRSVIPTDLFNFDYILAMDIQTIVSLEELAPKRAGVHLDLLLNYSPDKTIVNVPDPVCHDYEYFEKTFGLIKQGVQGFLNKIVHN